MGIAAIVTKSSAEMLLPVAVVGKIIRPEIAVVESSASVVAVSELESGSESVEDEEQEDEGSLGYFGA